MGEVRSASMGGSGEAWWREVEEQMKLDDAEHAIARVGKHHQLHVVAEHFSLDDSEPASDEDLNLSSPKRLKLTDTGADWWQGVEDAMSSYPIATAEPNTDLHVICRSSFGAKRQTLESPRGVRPLKVKRPG